MSTRTAAVRSSQACLRRPLAVVMALVFLVHLSACGTLLYPERHGQARGRVDPAVLLFDGALLVVFLVPGLVAFGIDFHTGAIYLPGKSGRVSRLRLPPEQLSGQRIEAIVREHSGRAFDLADPELTIRSVSLAGGSPEAALRLLEALQPAGPKSAGPVRTGS